MEIILALLMKYSHSTFPQCNQRWNFWNQVIFFNLSPSFAITSKFPTISWLTLHLWERICRKVLLNNQGEFLCMEHQPMKLYSQFNENCRWAVRRKGQQCHEQQCLVHLQALKRDCPVTGDSLGSVVELLETLLTQVHLLLTDTSIICHNKKDKSGLKQHIKIHWKEPFKRIPHL